MDVFFDELAELLFAAGFVFVGADFEAVLEADPLEVFFAAADLPAGLAALVFLADEPDLPADLVADLPAEADFAAGLAADLDVDLASGLLAADVFLEAASAFLLAAADLAGLLAPAFFTATSAAPLTAPFAAPLPTSEITFAACAATLPTALPTVVTSPSSELFLPVLAAAGFFVVDDLAGVFFAADFFSAIVSLLFN